MTKKSEERFLWFMHATVALLVLVAIWGHRYPMGADLPQHANLISNIARLWTGDASIEQRHLYRLEWFTPYAVCYALGALLNVVFSSLASMKILLTLFAFGMWRGLAKWLQSVGSDPVWAMAGMPVFFGFMYLWGFLSNIFALSVGFFYLSAVERSIARPFVNSGLPALAWGGLLFFSHGILFGVCMLITVLRLLMNRTASIWLRSGWHLAPLALLTLAWSRSGSAPSGGMTSSWFTLDRIELLFSVFTTFPSPEWARVGAVLVVASLVVLRPRINRHGGAWAALLVAGAAFVLLPDWLAGTWLVAARMSVFVQLFFLGIFANRRPVSEWLYVSRAWAWALASGLLILLNVRLANFNDEIAGMDRLAARIPARADVFQLTRQSDNVSPTFGSMSMTHLPAWVTAANGGIENEEMAFVFQMPLRRRAGFAQWFEYGLARGTLAQATAAANTELGPRAKLVATDGQWHLFRRAPQEFAGFELVRAIQDWGTLGIGTSVDHRPMTIAGTRYATGFGTHVNGWLRVRASQDGHFKGQCGVDDAAFIVEPISCHVLAENGQPRFDSGPLQKGAPATAFVIPVRQNEELILEVTSASGAIRGGVVDWVELRVE